MENLPDIGAMWREHMQKAVRKPSSRARLWASDLGHPCTRYHYYWLTEGEKAESTDWRLQGYFEEGRVHEREIRRLLEDLGLQVVETGTPAELKSPDVGAKIDYEIRYENKLLPIEAKSCSPHIFDKLSAAEDVLHHPMAHVRRWAAQLQVYLLGRAREVGGLLLKNKVTGEVKIIWMTIDMDFLDPLLKRAERAYKAKTTGEPPERIENIEHCDRCPFAKTTCYPTISRGDGIQLFHDEEIAGLLKRRDELKSNRDEFEDIDSRVKDVFKERGAGETICGEFLVAVKEQKRKVKVPITWEDKETTALITKIARVK